MVSNFDDVSKIAYSRPSSRYCEIKVMMSQFLSMTSQVNLYHVTQTIL